MSVLRMIGLQLFCGAIDGLPRDPFIFKMGIAIRETTPLCLLFGWRHLAAASGLNQQFKMSWHDFILSIAVNKLIPGSLNNDNKRLPWPKDDRGIRPPFHPIRPPTDKCPITTRVNSS